MGLFDSGQGINSTIGAVSSTFGAISNFSNGGGIGGLVDNLTSGNFPAAGEVVGDVMSAISLFNSDTNSNDWRVRLSLPAWSSFQNSPVLTPLKDAGGFIFPYTPSITINQSAKYSPIATTHNNYPFHAYENSDPGTIQITAPMNVEDPSQALYWIAALHYCRSVTKMFMANDPKAGNPPPIVMLNGYGNYVFKNIPVVMTSFNTVLAKDCDYIGCNVVGSAAGAVQGVSDSVGGLASLVGGAFPDLSGIPSTISNIAGTVGQISQLAGTFGLGGATSAGVAYVPTKSEFTITLQPMYSRTNARNFSLDRFVQGGYVNQSFGYI